MNDTVLDVADLTLQHGSIPAVRGVSFSIAPGEALGIVGESGSGKSSIARAIIGLGTARQTAGQILFDGMHLERLTPGQRRTIQGRRIGWVPQDPFTALNPALRVGWQIAEPMVHHLRLPWREALHKARDLLAEVGIDDPALVARRYPHQMSGGMRQRALIASAISCAPSLLVLDEPTTALDVTVEARILALLSRLRRQRGMGMLFISHNLHVVRQVCDRLGVLYAGQLVEQGPARAIIREPAHPYAKGLLAAMPRLLVRTARARLPSIPGSMADAPAPDQGCTFAPRCPFSEPRCHLRQDLRRTDERAVRCWKHDRIDPWPVPEEPPATSRAVASSYPVMEAHGVSKSYRPVGWRRFAMRAADAPAVSDVSLAIAPGEIFGLVGESGCGKSTLGRLLLRLLELDAGRVVFAGRDITRWSSSRLRAIRQQAQLVFQSVGASLNPRQTVGQALERPLALLRQFPRRDRKGRVGELLSLVNLPTSFAHRYPHQLSGGEKQRVAIARALATNPRFIVCDEPVSALDVSVQAVIVNLLVELRDRLGISYLFVSHDIALVSHTADRIAVMFKGAICEIGTTSEVLAPPYHPYTRALLLPAGCDPGPIEAGTDEPPSRQGCGYRHRCRSRVAPICDTVKPALARLDGSHAMACHFPTNDPLHNGRG